MGLSSVKFCLYLFCIFDTLLLEWFRFSWCRSWVAVFVLPGYAQALGWAVGYYASIRSLKTLFRTSFTGATKDAGNDLDTSKAKPQLDYDNYMFSATYLSSFAGIGYVTQVGSALVSITPIVGMLFRAHSWSRT